MLDTEATSLMYAQKTVRTLALKRPYGSRVIPLSASLLLHVDAWSDASLCDQLAADHKTHCGDQPGE